MSQRGSTAAQQGTRQQEGTIDGHPIFAAAYDRFGGIGEDFLAEHRAYLADDLQGSVLDLGAGTGDTFPALARAAENEEGLSIHAIEPDPHMERRAKRAARQELLDIDLRLARAESLPHPDESFDTVIASLVFCTIADPERALEEIDRVLRPGGELRFLEHVRSDGLFGRAQDLLAPAWKVVGAGCHLNRDFRTLLTRSPLETIDIETIRAPPPATPMLRGTAVRRH
jgi:ubiquinone/menaquinone biosynthesis C-methylase UbiE